MFSHICKGAKCCMLILCCLQIQREAQGTQEGPRQLTIFLEGGRLKLIPVGDVLCPQASSQQDSPCRNDTGRWGRSAGDTVCGLREQELVLKVGGSLQVPRTTGTAKKYFRGLGDLSQ